MLFVAGLLIGFAEWISTAVGLAATAAVLFLPGAVRRAAPAPKAGA